MKHSERMGFESLTDSVLDAAVQIQRLPLDWTVVKWDTVHSMNYHCDRCYHYRNNDVRRMHMTELVLKDFQERITSVWLFRHIHCVLEYVEFCCSLRF